MIDIHSHILPGVDDGARDFDSAIAAVKWLVRQGVTDIIATPHYVVESEYVSPVSANSKLLDELQGRLDKEGVLVNLYLGNEIYINEKIAELVAAGEITGLASSRYLLVELPLSGEYMNYEGYLQELINAGFIVVLAHPERYESFQDDYQLVRNLDEIGVMFQCNLRSFLGFYGVEAERLVHKLAREKMIFVLASDTHRAGREEYLVQARGKLSRFYNEREISQLLEVNPRRILFDKIA